ncbi:hypothetical protein HPB49_007350 [Dermacentor silvarum]|uniref:Uncharacterized protein n=1 Tax=Dermacentor silvarum TaxID=543639 RepID=A0ACB8CVS2_DERSI|nr:hypothetical protein HPB49_007350 [Dermacentor silvarum]
MAAKSTLAVYRRHKQEISTVDFYDNALGSKLLFEARAGALRTLARQRRISDEVPSVVRRACGKAEETIDHVVLLCDAIGAPAAEDITIGAALGFEIPGLMGDADWKPAKLFDETDPDWAPSLLLDYSAMSTDPSRHQRLEKRQADAEKREAELQERRADAEATGPCADFSPHPTGETDADESDTGVAVQTVMSMEDIQLLEQQCISLNERLYAARIEKEELEISENSLRSCERKIMFYMGMANFTVLLAVFKLLESAVSHSINNSLSKFQEFILFMMKIKRAHGVYKLFQKNVHLLAFRLVHIVRWNGMESWTRWFDDLG